MKNRIAPLGQLFHQLAVADIALNEIKPSFIPEALDILQAARAKIIDNNNLIAVRQKALGKM